MAKDVVIDDSDEEDLYDAQLDEMKDLSEFIVMKIKQPTF